MADLSRDLCGLLTSGVVDQERCSTSSLKRTPQADARAATPKAMFFGALQKEATEKNKITLVTPGDTCTCCGRARDRLRAATAATAATGPSPSDCRSAFCCVRASVCACVCVCDLWKCCRLTLVPLCLTRAKPPCYARGRRLWRQRASSAASLPVAAVGGVVVRVPSCKTGSGRNNGG